MAAFVVMRDGKLGAQRPNPSAAGLHNKWSTGVADLQIHTASSQIYPAYIGGEVDIERAVAVQMQLF